MATYAPFIALVRQNGFGFEASHVLAAPMAPLMLLLLGSIGLVVPASPFAIASLAAPILYGTLGLGLFSFIRGRLNWSRRDSLLVVLLATVYLLPLRYSWDNLKDLLGLGAFFAALGQVPRDAERGSWTLFAVLASVAVLTEEVEAVLISALSGYMILRTWRRSRPQGYGWLAAFLGCSSLVILYSHTLFPAGASPFPPYAALPTYLPVGNVSASGLVDYANYFDISVAATLLIGLGLAPLALPAIKGYFQDNLLDGMVILLSIGTFSIFLPGFTANVWPTWLFVLSFPLILYAYRGFSKMDRGITVGLMVLILLTSLGFLSLPPQNALPYLTLEQTRVYVPTSVMQNTIPLDRIIAVNNAVVWLNVHVGSNDVVVVSNAFYGYLQVDGKPMQLYPFYNVNSVNWIIFRNHGAIYSIAWSDGTTWYDGGQLPPAFHLAFSSAGVGVYEANPQNL